MFNQLQVMWRWSPRYLSSCQDQTLINYRTQPYLQVNVRFVSFSIVNANIAHLPCFPCCTGPCCAGRIFRSLANPHQKGELYLYWKRLNEAQICSRSGIMTDRAASTWSAPSLSSRHPCRSRRVSVRCGRCLESGCWVRPGNCRCGKTGPGQASETEIEALHLNHRSRSHRRPQTTRARISSGFARSTWLD